MLTNIFFESFTDVRYEYSIRDEIKLTWHDAVKSCREWGGHLTTVSTLVEDLDLARKLTEKYGRSIFLIFCMNFFINVRNSKFIITLVDINERVTSLFLLGGLVLQNC